jgi:hypothetical protein
MKRRKCFALMALAVAWPSVMIAQQASIPTIGLLHSASIDAVQASLAVGRGFDG